MKRNPVSGPPTGRAPTLRPNGADDQRNLAKLCLNHAFHSLALNISRKGMYPHSYLRHGVGIWHIDELGLAADRGVPPRSRRHLFYASRDSA